MCDFLIGSAFWLLPAFNTFSGCPSTKSPLRRRRRGRYLVEAGEYIPRRETSLVAKLPADDVAEQVPLLALEPHHLQLLDHGEVGRASVDLDSGQKGVWRKVL